MLKPKAKNRSLANRNLSLAILYQEQYNHLPFATSSYRHPSKERNLSFTNQIDGHSYSFFRPQKLHGLSQHETSHLVVYYTNLFDCTTTEIGRDHFDPNITKYAHCLLANDSDGISSEWYESRRSMVMSTRISSVVCFSQKGDGGGLVRQYGRVQCFFLHEYRNSKRMLAYIQIYRGKDRSVEWGYTQEGKIIELQ